MIVFAVSLLHFLTNGRYGFHRDELQFLSGARHLDWGYAEFPPLTSAFYRLELAIFGVSLSGLRLISVLAQAASIFVSGLMAREFGGGRLAQSATALAVALSPIPLFLGTEFQYSSLDYLWWILVSYFTIRLLRSENPRWWLAIGAVLGLGLLTKYTIAVLAAGVLGGLLITRQRRGILSGWFWGAVGLTLVIFLPNLLWQMQHHFISYDFLEFIHERDVRLGRDEGFLPEQVLVCFNIFALPLVIAGFVELVRTKRYRMLAWMFLIPLATFFFSKGRSYYLAASYPPLIAMGAALGSRLAQSSFKLSRQSTKLRRRGQPARARRGSLVFVRTIEIIFFAGVILWGAWTSAIMIPFQATGPLRDFALARNYDLREEFGWDDLVRKVAAIRDTLSPEQQEHLGVFAANYGEQGAIELLGTQYHLPAPISSMNSAWLRGFPNPAPTTLIVVGVTRQGVSQDFTNCRLAGANTNSAGVKNEESTDHPDIFVCGPPQKPWPRFWAEYKTFG
jgi:hypothetical protein